MTHSASSLPCKAAAVSSAQQSTVNTNNEGDKEKEVQLTDIEITDENMALNVLVSFVSLAQKRGAFSLPESSKIWECVKAFQKNAISTI